MVSHIYLLYSGETEEMERRLARTTVARSFVGSLVRSFGRSLGRSVVHWFVSSFGRSVGGSFVSSVGRSIVE